MGPAATMASADFWRCLRAPFDARSQRSAHRPDLPGYCAPSVTLMRVGSTSLRSVHVPGFTDLCLLTPQRRLYPLPVRRASALPPASFRRPVTQAALAVQLTVPRVGSVEDFHLQEGAPCRAHKKRALTRRAQSGGERLNLYRSLPRPPALRQPTCGHARQACEPRASPCGHAWSSPSAFPCRQPRRPSHRSASQACEPRGPCR